MPPQEAKGKTPQDIVAIFHASFHPIKGNVIDWSLTASDGRLFQASFCNPPTDFSLCNLEFSTLPSGLHLVEQDVVYFSKDSHHGVCIYRRRPTTELGHRGYHLTSLGILLAKSARPRPWRHVSALKEVSIALYSKFDAGDVLDPNESIWEPAIHFFDERKVRRADLGGAGDWNGWSYEMETLNRLEPGALHANPTIHLSHLLRILGPSSLTLYKHVLGRRRILIYTLPPVEAACILCHVAADLCYEVQSDHGSTTSNVSTNCGNEPQRLKGRCKEAINVLGMVTLNDVDRMKEDGKSGCGWIACTTDAIFLEKPECYDLVIDLTTSSPRKATRPVFYASRPIHRPPGGRGPTHRLSVIRFAWSDVRLWNELDRILRLDTETNDHCCNDLDAKSRFISTWTDAWRVYEDVCIICAGLWMGSWRGNSTMSYSTGNGSMANWGSIKLEGDDDLTVTGSYVRNLGMGIEGRPSVTVGGSHGTVSPSSPTISKRTKSSGPSWSTGEASSSGATAAVSQPSSSTLSNPPDTPPDSTTDNDLDTSDRSVRTTLALLQTFHANTCFQLSRLQTLLSQRDDHSATTSGNAVGQVMLTPKDILSFELGPLSAFDARYLEWLAEEYATGTKVILKRGWRDICRLLIFGYS